MDILFVLYRKDLPEPIWIGKPELSGSLTAQLPYMEYSYGEYFLLIANLTPAPHLQQQFKRMDFCWRVDFEFLPNGIHLEHPENTVQYPDDPLFQGLCIVKYPSFHGPVL